MLSVLYSSGQIPVGAVPEGFTQLIAQHGSLQAMPGIRFPAEVNALILEIGDASPAKTKPDQRKKSSRIPIDRWMPARAKGCSLKL